MESLMIGSRKIGRRGKGLCIMLPSIWLKNVDNTAGSTVTLTIEDDKLIIEPEVKQK